MARIRRGDDGLSRKLEVWADSIEREVERGIKETAAIIETSSKGNAPVDEGFLRQSIETTHLGSVHSRVTVGANYAVYVEYGTGIYATRGSRASKIPWSYQRADGNWVTTYGNPAQPFWTPALLSGEQYFKNYFN